jgi:hypothetical protein
MTAVRCGLGDRAIRLGTVQIESLCAPSGCEPSRPSMSATVSGPRPVTNASSLPVAAPLSGVTCGWQRPASSMYSRRVAPAPPENEHRAEQHRAIAPALGLLHHRAHVQEVDCEDSGWRPGLRRVLAGLYFFALVCGARPGSVAGVTGKTSVQRLRGISLASAANHTRSAGSYRIRRAGAAVRSRAGAPAAQHPSLGRRGTSGRPC